MQNGLPSPSEEGTKDSKISSLVANEVSRLREMQHVCQDATGVPSHFICREAGTVHVVSEQKAYLCTAKNAFRQTCSSCIRFTGFASSFNALLRP